MAHRKELGDLTSRESVVARISTLTAESSRHWGKMSAHQMLCHLTDSYRAVIGERKISQATMWIPRPILKLLILYAPWPKNAPTRPEVDQNVGGTPPTDFEGDRLKLIEAINRFCSAPESVRSSHPLLGRLNHEEWMRWGYVHADHHLRQFGA